MLAKSAEVVHRVARPIPVMMQKCRHMENGSVPAKRRPGVGVGVIIKRADGRILFLQRQGAHGEGAWSFPGGHLEWGESFEQCGAREAMEETGVLIKNIRVIGVTDDVFGEEDKHYVTVFVCGEFMSGEARVMEPEKMTRVEWCFPDILPTPLFIPTMNFLRQGIDLTKL